MPKTIVLCAALLETGRRPKHLCLSKADGPLMCKNKYRYPEHGIGLGYSSLFESPCGNLMVVIGLFQTHNERRM